MRSQLCAGCNDDRTGVNIREHEDLALGWESGIGTSGQYPRPDLIPGNMDDELHRRNDEAVLGVRATGFLAGGEVRLLMIAASGGGNGTQGE
jgi:hypothetical protein